MKTSVQPIKIFQLLASIFFVLITLGSCKKENTEEVISPGMSFIVNGTAKKVSGAESVKASFNERDVFLHILADLDSTSEKVSLKISDFRGKGDYEIGNKAEAVYTNGTVPQSNTYFGNSGVLKVTSYSKTGVKGTFQFYSTNALGFYKNITEGSFEAQVQKQ